MTDERELELLRPVLMAAAREIEPCGGLLGADDDALAVLCILRATKAAIDEFQNVRRNNPDAKRLRADIDHIVCTAFHCGNVADARQAHPLSSGGSKLLALIRAFKTIDAFHGYASVFDYETPDDYERLISDAEKNWAASNAEDQDDG